MVWQVLPKTAISGFNKLTYRNMQYPVLVTGALGQLGRAIARQAGEHHGLAFHYADLAELDITDAQATDRFVDQLRPAAVINCAAYTAVDRAESQPDLARAVNAAGAANLARAAERHGALMVHVSTDFVFDGNRNTPYTEECATAPLGVYGATKLEGEEAVRRESSRWAIVRTAWLYSDGGGNFVDTMLRLAGEREQLNVVVDQLGSPTAADDLASALLALADKNLVEGVPATGLFHYTNEGVCSWYDLATRAIRLAGLGCKVNPIATSQYPTPARRPAYSVLCKDKIRRALGIEIPHWEESLQRVLERKLNR